jgi:hypothetical protein
MTSDQTERLKRLGGYEIRAPDTAPDFDGIIPRAP